MLTLRAHHINCLFFFNGLGYNEEFTKEMTNLKESLILNSNVEFILTCENDDLCKKCIHQLPNRVCTSQLKVQSLDKKALKVYNLEANSIYNFQDIKNTIYKHFDRYKFEEICSQCEWYKANLCHSDLIDFFKQPWK